MNDYKIKELYEKMEMDLIDSMKRNLSRHLAEEEEVGFKYTQWQAEKLKELKRFQRENKKTIGGYVKGLNKEVSEHLQEELRQGSISAIKQYNKLLGDNKNPSKLMNRSFFRTNDRKVKALIKAVNNDLNKANIGALRMINDEYRQIIHKSAFFVANGVKTEKQATSMAIKEISEKKATMEACDEVSKTFLAGGLNCIEYSNGRRVNIASYAAMAVRTASLRAHLMGEGDFRKSIGRTLVKVTSHGGACKLCTAWQGKVLVDDVYSGGEPDGKHQLLSEAMKQGFLHPNCRHGITTYYPELEGISYDEDEGDEFLPDELISRRNYVIRNIKKYDRLSSGQIDPDNIKNYKNRKKSWEDMKPIDYYDTNDRNMIKYKINQFEEKIIDSDIEHAYIFNRFGEILKIDGNTGIVRIPSWIDLKDSIITHNHPKLSTNYSLSEDDLTLFFNRDVKELRGLDNEYKYYIKRKKNTIVDVDSLKQDITEYRNEAFELARDGKLDIDHDEYHFINRKLSKKYNFTYVRRKIK